MKKIFKLSVVLTALCIALMIASLCACAAKPEQPQKLQSFKLGEIYEEFNDEPISIEVNMSDEYRGSFTIEDKERIDEIYSFVTEQVWFLYEDVLPPGSNKSVKFVFDNGS